MKFYLHWLTIAGSKLLKALLLLPFFFSGNLRAQNTNRPPNIIFIVTDDLGWADLGCYGNRYYHTPNIDSLAKMGMRFTHAYASSPVCSPSRAGILSGLNPARLHLTNYLEGRTGDTASNLLPAPFVKYLPASVYMIPEALQRAGYLSALIGKWHLGEEKEALPGRQGFNYELVSHNHLQFYKYTLTTSDSIVYKSPGDEELTDHLTKETIHFLNNNKDTTFFLYLGEDAPHLLLQPKPWKLPLYYFTYNSLSKGKYSPQYAAVLENLDDNIGVLMKALQQNNLWENTLLIVTSDNGGSIAEEFGQKPTDNSPLRNGKGTLYEGGLRIPLLMIWQGHILPGSVNESITANIDLFPTFLKVAGISDTHTFDGIDISSSFLNNKTISDRTLWWHYPHFSNQEGRPCSGLLSGSYKLITYYETGKTELYDLKNDESEQHDLSAQLPQVTDSLHRRLQDILKEAGASMPVPKKDLSQQ